MTTSSTKKIKVRIILPGSGVRAAFQMGFMKELLDSKMFEVDKVYGCSAGALLAPLVVTNKVDLLVRDMEQFKTVEDLVEPWTYLPNIPGVKNPFASIYNGLQRMLGPNSYVFQLFSIVHMYFDLGLYKRLVLYDRIIGYLTNADKKIVEEKCVVVAYDIMERKETYFQGKDVIPGIQASSALWMLVPPVKYKGKQYTDGGVTARYPFGKIDEHWDGLYIVVDALPPKMMPRQKPYTNVVNFVYELVQAVQQGFDEEKVVDAKTRLKNKLLMVYADELYMENGLDISEKKVMKAYDAGRIKFHDFLLEHISTFNRFIKK